jgi:hypothetical protein
MALHLRLLRHLGNGNEELGLKRVVSPGIELRWWPINTKRNASKQFAKQNPYPKL